MNNIKNTAREAVDVSTFLSIALHYYFYIIETINIKLVAFLQSFYFEKNRCSSNTIETLGQLRITMVCSDYVAIRQR